MKSQRPDASAERMVGLRRGKVHSSRERPDPVRGAALRPGEIIIPAGEPRLTRESAMQLAKLLAAGLPQYQAMTYVAPEYARGLSKYQRPRWRERWMNDALLLDATTALNGAPWIDLPPDRRLEIALDTHFAQLAHFLYTHDYAKLQGEDLKKADAARMALVAKLTGAETDAETPWMRAMRDLLSGALAHTPPQLRDDPPLVVPATGKES